jgi:hypothetical protein
MKSRKRLTNAGKRFTIDFTDRQGSVNQILKIRFADRSSDPRIAQNTHPE